MNEIIIYKSKDNQTQIEVKFDQETVWLDQYQITDLFKGSRSNIIEHIKNIYKSKELDENGTCRKFRQVRQEGKRNVEREIIHYNLDLIISVGYRVNSKRGVQFRQWATSRLKDYLIQGYAINEKRLKEVETKFKNLKQAIALLGEVSQAKVLTDNESNGLIKVLHDFSGALNILDQYDHQTLELKESIRKEIFRISYQAAKKAINDLKKKFGGSDLFGKEKDESLKSSLNTIYQTFNGKELYPGIEEKAANLLYFVVKNHSFADGNKRIAAFLFVWFLERNKLLDIDGKNIIDNNSLIALTLMMAASKPEDRDMMIKVVVNLLVNKYN